MSRQTKPAGYESCYAAIMGAKLEHPHTYPAFTEYFDVEALGGIRAAYGVDLYNECLKDATAAIERELKSGSGAKTVHEWFEEHPGQGCTIVWAADSPGFGMKGHTVYGDKSDCFVVREDTTPGSGLPRLHVWCESFGRMPA